MEIMEQKDALQAADSLLLAISGGGILWVGIIAILCVASIAGMALWFAPALVLLAGLKPVAALRASFTACLKNWLVLSVYGLLLGLLLLFGLLTIGLGLLVVLPLLAASLYFSYRDIFPDH